MRTLAFLLALFLCDSVLARNYDHGEDAMDPDIVKWYQSARQPNVATEYPQSCCGLGDAYWADEYRIDAQGRTIAILTDPRQINGRVNYPVGEEVVIPNDRYDNLFQGNPTGHGIVFMSAGKIVYCYFPAVGG